MARRTVGVFGGMWGGLRRAAVASVVAAVVTGQFTSCAKNPVTGRSELSLISEPQEIQLGAQAAEQAVAAIGLVDDPALQAYVQRLGEAIARDSERPELPWTFGVLDDPTPNAFALPGGYVFVTRGMLSLMRSEAQLVAVLGHEVGHVTARHSVQQISQAQVAQLGLGLGSILLPELRPLTGLIGTGLELLFLSNSRSAEREADELGFRYAIEQDYDAREMGGIFVALERYQQREGVSALPTWLSTHPSPGSRVEDIAARGERLRGPVDDLRIGEGAYLARVEGLVHGNDPRRGFFRDGVFYHPEHALRVDFPEGWRTQKLPHVVVAASPQGDAVVQLSPVEGSTEVAARNFLAQAGVQGGRVTEERISGLPAVVASFQAQTQQGVVQGLAAFVRHGGQTYGMLGYAPASRIARHQGTLMSTIESFAPVTDRAILDVQPARLAVVELPTAMTAAAFHERYPSAVSLDEVLLINQIASPQTQLPAGRLMKRVVAERPVAWDAAYDTLLVSLP